jgi:AcrR family transcriptional regulator
VIDKSPDPELPRGVALAWGIAANPQRGPKREMSIEGIVDAAVEIADKGGLGAVSMSSVAASLGFTPMSLYRYITAKDDLVLLMQERGIGVPPEDVLEADDWRSGLTRWAEGQTQVFADHPWLLDIPIEGTPLTPNNLAWLDAALEALRDLALSYDEKVAVVLAVIAQVRWEGAVQRGTRAAAEAAGKSSDELDLGAAAVLGELVQSTQFPQVHAAMLEGVFSPVPNGNPFTFGLERVLDGVEAYLAGRSPAPRLPIDDLEEAARRDPKVKEITKARREAEKALREARKRERESIRNTRERLRR